MEKNLSKTTSAKLDPAKKSETNVKQQFIKNKHLPDYYFVMQSLFTVYKTGQFMKLYKIM